MHSTPKKHAAAWLVRLDADTSPATLDLWQQWLREDARHHAAFVRVEKGWRRAECLKSLRPLDREVQADLLEGLPIAAGSEVASTGPPGLRGAAPLRSQRRWKRGARARNLIQLVASRPVGTSR